MSPARKARTDAVGSPPGYRVLCRRWSRAVLKLELGRATSLGRERSHVSAAIRVAENGAAEFFVNQETGRVDCQLAAECVPESIVDHLLAPDDRSALSRR